LAKTTGFAQLNLVPNGSFEEYDTCPDNYSQIEKCTYWYAATLGTSDYYNTCADPLSYVSVPANLMGNQNTYDGNGYVGIFVLYADSQVMYNNYREYVQTKLTSNLIHNQEYYLEFYVCRGEKIGFSIDRIGALFTTYPISRNDAQPIIATPQIENVRHHIITDTVNWTKISGTFIASGGECYLTIGNFYDRYDCDVYWRDPNNRPWEWVSEDYAYYYIDGITFKLVDSWIKVPNVFTPNNDELNDFFIIDSKSIAEYKVVIFDRWGRQIFESNDAMHGWNGKHNGQECAEGVYYYAITAQGAEGKAYNLKGSIQLLR
jgi:gliding motility-associated-like protein